MIPLPACLNINSFPPAPNRYPNCQKPKLCTPFYASNIVKFLYETKLVSPYRRT